MVCKFFLFTLLVAVARAGVISLGEGEDFSSYEGAHALTHNHATSFMHFHGPVEGPVFEVKVPYVPHHGHGDHNSHLHQDHGYTLDYVAQPKYEFSYGVEDHHTGDFHGQKESREGKNVKGEYSVKEPSGNIRTVKYHADKDGFHAVVHNSGGNDHSGGVYGGQGEHHDLNLQAHEAPVQEEHLQEYAIYQSQEADSGHEGYL